MNDLALDRIIQVMGTTLSPEKEIAAEELINALPPGEERDRRIGLLGELRACREIAVKLSNAQSYPAGIDKIVQTITDRLNNSLIVLLSEEE